MEASCLVDIAPDKKENEVIVYPNPAVDNIRIESTGKIIGSRIRNYLGQQVLNQTGNKPCIDINSLPSGLYIIEVVGEDWSTRQKLIVR